MALAGRLCPACVVAGILGSGIWGFKINSADLGIRNRVPPSLPANHPPDARIDAGSPHPGSEAVNQGAGVMRAQHGLGGRGDDLPGDDMADEAEGLFGALVAEGPATPAKRRVRLVWAVAEGLDLARRYEAIPSLESSPAHPRVLAALLGLNDDRRGGERGAAGGSSPKSRHEIASIATSRVAKCNQRGDATGYNLGLMWWRGLDSNQRRVAPTDLQSVAFDRSATPPEMPGRGPERAG